MDLTWLEWLSRALGFALCGLTVALAARLAWLWLGPARQAHATLVDKEATHYTDAGWQGAQHRVQYVLVFRVQGRPAALRLRASRWAYGSWAVGQQGSLRWRGGRLLAFQPAGGGGKAR